MLTSNQKPSCDQSGLIVYWRKGFGGIGNRTNCRDLEKGCEIVYVGGVYLSEEVGLLGS